MDIRAGMHLGRYQLLAEIGRGAMGTVYQALDPEIDRLVAIKTFSTFDLTDEEAEEFRQRFANEARAAGRLTHPNIIGIYDRGEEPDSQMPYIVMEYVAGQPLHKLLSASGNRLDERTALTLTRNIAEGLAYAHSKGVVHRDIKPANIIVTEEGVAKIADFGIARLDTSNLTLHGQVLGTPAFMSPEQLSDGTVDGRSDLFSLGVILYTMLMGFRPFQGRGASTIVYKVINQSPLPLTSFHLDLSRDSEYVVARAMAKNPEHRYQTGTAFAEDCDDILAGKEPRSRKQMDAPLSAEISRAYHLPSLQTPTPVNSLVAAAAPLTPVPTPTPRAESEPASTSTVAVVAKALSPWHISPPVGFLLVFAISVWAGSALYAHRAETAELRALDAALAPPALISENIPVPAIGGATRERVVRFTAPITAAQTTARAAVSDLDTTVVHRQPVVAAALPPKAVPAKATPSVTPPTPALAPVTLDVALQHHFREAELEVWVDNKLAFSGMAHGEAKKHLLLLKGAVEGRESHQLQFAGGEHDVKVRVASKADSYDQTGSIHSTFAGTGKPLLEVRCNRDGIQLRLTASLSAAR